MSAFHQLQTFVSGLYAGPVPLLTTLLVLAVEAARQPEGTVAAFRCASSHPAMMIDPEVRRRAYIQRSATIVETALSGSVTKLKPMVSPNATSVRFKFDSGAPSHSRGPAGVIEQIKSISPRSYEVVDQRGLMSPVGPACTRNVVTLSLTGAKRDEAHVVTMEYDRGELLKIVVHDADYSAGEFRKRGAH